MMSLLLPYATTGLSRIARWCVIGAPPRGQPRMPAMMLPHGCSGLRVWWMTVLCMFRRPFMDRPVPRQLMRNELARFYHHRARNCLPPRKLRRDIQ